jgi:hypothetical protein
VFYDGALANPLAESELPQPLRKTKIERVRYGGDADDCTCSWRILAVISTGTFRTGGYRDSGGSSGHIVFYYVRNEEPVSHRSFRQQSEGQVGQGERKSASLVV